MPPTPGLLVIDKPLGPSSRAVLDGMERRLKIGPLGHTGTLDPLASGLLIVLAGSARRLQDMLMASSKTYDAEVTLGATSVTLDGEGPVTTMGTPVPSLSEGDMRELIGRFTGAIEQLPPPHSAVHVGGKRAYELARRGEAPALRPRTVSIDHLELTGRSGNILNLRVRCGPGTYIRSLARDLGEDLGCGAYLSGLRRVVSGPFEVADARTPEEVSEEHLLPLAAILGSFNRVDVDRQDAVRLSLGQSVTGLEVGPDAPTFAWLDDHPVCRLRATDGGARSDLRLREIRREP